MKDKFRVTEEMLPMEVRKLTHRATEQYVRRLSEELDRKLLMFDDNKYDWLQVIHARNNAGEMKTYIRNGVGRPHRPDLGMNILGVETYKAEEIIAARREYKERET